MVGRVSLDFDARIAWLDRPTVDGRALDGPSMAPVTTARLPLIQLCAGRSAVVGEVREIYLRDQVVHARGHVWAFDDAQLTRDALQAGRTLPCGVNVMAARGGVARMEPTEQGLTVYDWVIAGLTVYLDDTRPAWPDACLRASAP